MRKQFQRWRQKMRHHKRWMMGAIATPVLLGMAGWRGSPPDRQLQPETNHRSSLQSSPLTNHPQREPLLNGMGAIALAVSGVFLVLNSRNARRPAETINLSGADLSGANLSRASLGGADLNAAELSRANLIDANLSGADLGGADLNGAELSGANLSGANLSGANLSGANLSGSDLNGAELRYANLSGADLRYANLSGADLRYANLSGADLNCTLLSDANLSDANLSGALLFFINSREVQNLEPLQLKAKPSPFLCHVALPAYAHQPEVNPNRDCDRIPQLLSTRYHISLEEAQGIVNEARQHRWD